MCILLDNFNLHLGLYSSNYCSSFIVYITGMLEQVDHELIQKIISLPDNLKTIKANILQLKKIKDKVTNTYEKDCMCSSVRRKIWFKDFIQWYETYT
jgi:hypothetical protein